MNIVYLGNFLNVNIVHIGSVSRRAYSFGETCMPDRQLLNMHASKAQLRKFFATVTLKAPLVVSRVEIEALLPSIDAIRAMEAAFSAYSSGQAVVPPVGEILFPGVNGEAHIKSGYITGDDVFVVKVATGFYRNAEAGLPTSSGAMLVFGAKDGMAKAVLLDEGLLTDYRTAAAGALAARLLGPKQPQKIGILGSGIQARLQARLLSTITSCRTIALWARRPDAARSCADDLIKSGFAVEIAASPTAVSAQSDLIITTTASRVPLLAAKDIRPGTHITAVGADTPEKCELSSDLLAKADILAVDSLTQARERGELHHAMTTMPDLARKAIELGTIALGSAPGRTNAAQITIADLTGVAVQDIEIAKAVLAALERDAS